MKPTGPSIKLKIPAAEAKLSFRKVAAILKDPLTTLCSLTQRYGGIVQLRILHRKFIVIEDPVYFKYILQEQYRNFYKYDLSGLLTRFLGEGLVTSNGGFWLQQRKIIQPAFHRQHLENTLAIIHNELDTLIAALKKEIPYTHIDIGRQLMELNLRIMAGTLFGATTGKDIQIVSAIMHELAREAATQVTRFIKLPLGIPTSSNTRFKKARKKFDTFLYTLIDERKKQIAEGNAAQQDILQLLLISRSEETGDRMPDKQVRDELTTLFMAGYETTSQTLSWLFYQLAREPAIADAVRAEINDCITQQRVTLTDLAKLTYTTCVIRETLRFYPSIWLLARKNLAADLLGQYALPKGSVSLLNIYGMHHNKAYWDEPEEFRPARFTAERMKEQQPYTYLPFGSGPRSCIGQPFAMMVMQVIVSRLVTAFNCQPVDGPEISIEPHITLRPKPAIYVRFEAIGND